MNSKTLVFAAAAAAVIAMSGCNTMPSSYPMDSGGKSYVDCRKTLDCQVTLPHKLWKTEYPDEIWINVPYGQKVNITWTIKGNDDTTFDPDGGINLKAPTGQRAFVCKQDPQHKHVYSCYNTTDLAPTYEYGIKTKGFWSGPNIDPVIKNGA